MRVFFAFPLPKNLQDMCMKLINDQQSKKHLEEVRWVKQDHLHITVRFIADITALQLNQLTEILPKKLADCASITLETRRLLLLPPRTPHLVSLSIHLNKEIANVYRAINDTTTEVGLTPERRAYVPHISLGRFKHPTVSEFLHITTPPVISGTIQQVILYLSEPNEHGSVYTELNTFDLG
ncbi:MAG: RNA 2',3'-cyclic phosphodiesterase [Pseudomonadota bacterium]|nr:RNA 2',3'-cyclic phosphodiesterase [Pseudomonadota bacterium]